MVRPERFERPTYWFVASCSIQLSYGRTPCKLQPSQPQLSKFRGFHARYQPAQRPQNRRIALTYAHAPGARDDVRGTRSAR
jgi:hypothetical protein